MPLQIFLNATLRQYIPDYDPYQGLSVETPPGTTVGQVMAQLGLPEKEITLIMVDGRRREMDFQLQGNERLGLFRLSAGAEQSCGAGVPPAIGISASQIYANRPSFAGSL